ncbi:hypothetical protein [Streptomyces sp. 184]|uniref:hypothetical protein n=1 Tax=Streptomyces sp. 184 TaxID=1827526 RepID=UPI0038924D62
MRTHLSPRQHRLWALLSGRKKVTTGDAWAANRALGAPKRTTARADVERLRDAGLLVEYGPVNGRWYEPAGGAA